MEEIILSCGFHLRFEPYKLQLSFKESHKKVACKPKNFVFEKPNSKKMDTLIYLYKCPFWIIESNDYVDRNYWMSEGLAEETAIIYRQDGEHGEIIADGLVEKVVRGFDLKNWQLNGIMTKYGELLVHIEWDVQAAWDAVKKEDSPDFEGKYNTKFGAEFVARAIEHT